MEGKSCQRGHLAGGPVPATLLAGWPWHPTFLLTWSFALYHGKVGKNGWLLPLEEPLFSPFLSVCVCVVDSWQRPKKKKKTGNWLRSCWSEISYIKADISFVSHWWFQGASLYIVDTRIKEVKTKNQRVSWEFCEATWWAHLWKI